MNETKLISAFLIGLMSSAHCLGMCGGISIAFGLNTSRGGMPSHFFKITSSLFALNIGRIICYSLLGLLAGLLSGSFMAMFGGLALLLRVMSGVMLIAMGMYIAQWWMGLSFLERGGRYLWKNIQPLTQKLAPVTNISQALLLGICWGFLPCGLVYSVLIWAMASQSAQESAVLMLFFGLGTLPAMVASSFGASQLKFFMQNSIVRVMVALLLCSLGIWTVVHALVHHF